MHSFKRLQPLCLVAVSFAAFLAACSSSSSNAPATNTVPEDLDMTEADFDCILNWTKVRDFRVTNKLGHDEATLAVANDPGKSNYPVGTVIQLVPTEAMVKRAAGFSADSHDWEFFFLGVSATGTTITQRGVLDVQNQFGASGNCFNCHSTAEAQWDLVCETGHGCAPLPLSSQVLQSVQNSDARCPKP